MAKMMNNSMSSDTQITTAFRHKRLCYQYGAEQLSTAITTPIAILEAKKQASLLKRNDRYTTYDFRLMLDGQLDDTIRNISAAVKQFDRDNVGRPLYAILFPDGGFTAITGASFHAELDKAQQLLQRLKSLGEGHTLQPHIEPLTAKIAACRIAETNFYEAVTEEKTALAEESLAKTELCQQYEFNYLDAIKLFGKTHANRLFPKSVSSKKIEEPVTVTEN